MSAMQIDQSLDTILKEQRNTRGRARRSKPVQKAKATAAPAGGIKKSTKAAKPAAKPTKPVPTGPSAVDGKIIVSGLPTDVNEANIKEYFNKSAGSVKRVMLTYNQNGTSRGIATIIFGRAETAQKAAKELNGLLVDGRPMKIELVIDAKTAEAVPGPKSLGDRVAQPKKKNEAKPKSATAAPKAATAAKTAAGAAGKKGRRGRNAGRPKRKTAEELDADMTDYFNAGAAPAPAAAAAPAPAAVSTADEVAMEEL